eukprot:CAMPEP_0176485668 /NCGR_PEP_ID=MMETSP0200_2-20121128/5158_1 /TAXON_ID=947934 /ORGANISM="Chaetoceros sp., Strain GSL56" /LENGTH=963 /DNA_ID=CAMNT_0017882319 /DNA_START=538 /DNA_END=3429 /DNA_ORIENTATION=+
MYILLLWKLLHDKSEVQLMENFIDVDGSGSELERIQYRPVVVVASTASKQRLGSSSLEIKSLVEEIKSRHAKRKLRTTKYVEKGIDTYRAKVKRYNFHFLNSLNSQDTSIFDYHDMRSNWHQTGSAEDNIARCGIEAQNPDFFDNLMSFPLEWAMNQNSVVLITGILSRIGFHLALKLAAECKVQVVIGVDAIYSNEYTSKLQQLEQIKLLYAQVSQLKKPLMVAFDGIHPKQSRRPTIKTYLFNEITGEFDFEESVVPTHVLHVLSSEKSSFQILDRAVDDDLFLLRQSLTATEQLLTTLGASSKVHFTFVSRIGALDNSEGKDLFQTTKMMEEILLQYYSKRLSISSFVVLRIPTIYGPWGRPGSIDFDLTQQVILSWIKGVSLTNNELDSELSFSDGESVEAEKDILFVDDAVSAIIAGMQYESPYSNMASFNLLSGEKISAVGFTHLITSLLDSSTRNTIDHAHDNDHSSHDIHSHLSLRARQDLRWHARVILRDGVKQLLAWHLDEKLPFGLLSSTSSSFNVTISQFLQRQGDIRCHTEDVNCPIGRRLLPCASECSNPSFCSNSAFDYSAHVSRQISENCEIVLYSAFLSDNTADIDVITAPQTDDQSMCSIAFILESSSFAKDLLLDHVDPNSPEKSTIYYKGWHIVLIKMQQEHLSWKLRHLLKLSPRHFFHSSVKAALYIPPNFTTKPEVDDVLFTTGLLHRRPIVTYSTQRAYHREMEKMKYMVGQSQRDALIILPGAVIGENPQVHQVMSGSYPTKVQKVSVEKGMRSMVDDNLWSDDEEEEATTSTTRRSHMEFEKDISNIFNNFNFFEKRQATSDTFKFSHRHWTRNHWVVHNFERPDAQTLRCDWYLEQIKWNDDNDNISFAHILARMEFERYHKFANDEAKSNMLDEQTSKFIDLQSDEYQWSMVMYPNSDTNDVGYVRILDDRALMIERKLWQIRNNDEMKQKSFVM